jgi:hypothetical protein
MQPKQFEKALLALRTWQAAKSDNMDELQAIACTFRNRVLKFGKTYSQVLEVAEVNRDWPDIKHPLLIEPTNGLLAFVEGVYDNVQPDFTANHLHKNGALYFGHAFSHQDKGDWFDNTVLDNPNEHPLIGTWGTQQFYE